MPSQVINKKFRFPIFSFYFPLLPYVMNGNKYLSMFVSKDR